MKLYLERIFTSSTYTIGKLYLIDKNGNKKYIMDTIEDTDRGLHSKMDLAKIKTIKIMHETAIPTGTYEITLNVKSPKYSNFSRYPQYRKYGGYMPRLLNVPGFSGILIHTMNTAKDSSGCIGIGKNTEKGKITESTIHFYKLMDEYLVPTSKKNEKIEITIVSKYKK